MSVYTPGNFHTVEDGPWPAGTTVAVWSVDDVVGGVPVGAEIDNGVAGPDGTVTFGGLTEGLQYTAFGHGGTQTFYAVDADSNLAALQSPDGVWHRLLVENDGRLATQDISGPITGPAPPSGIPGDIAALDARLDSVETKVVESEYLLPAATGVRSTDTTSITQFLNGVSSAGTALGKLRRGNYKIDPIAFPVMGSGAVELAGQGPEKTTLTFDGASGDAITFGDGGATDTRWQGVRDLTLLGNANADTAVKLNHSRFCKVQDCVIKDFTKAGAIGLYTVPGEHNYFAEIIHNQFANIPIGVKLESAGFIGGNSNRVVGNHFSSHPSYGLIITGATGNFVERNEFGGSIAVGFRVEGASGYNMLVANVIDGPTVAGEISSGVNATVLVGNSGLGTLSDSSPSTIRLDFQGLILPRIATPGVKRALFFDSGFANRLAFINDGGSAPGYLSSVLRLARSSSYTVVADSPWDVIAYNSLSAPVTVTLPLANAFHPGRILIVKDEAGTAATNNITISRAGSDTIDGATTKVINTNGGSARIYADGTSKWFSV